MIAFLENIDCIFMDEYNNVKTILEYKSDT